MPYRTEWVDPEIALEHNGVTVYHVYKNDNIYSGAMTYWFTLYQESEGEDAGQFDVRELETPSSDLLDEILSGDDHKQAILTIIREAIDLGLVKKET